jgi:RNA polymerase sigma-70 factor (ECF subfamily)
MLGNDAQTPDESLLSGFLSGDERMFTELVRRYEQPLYRFICRLTGDPAESADLFQETFVRVYQRAGTFRGASPFRTWVYAIAVNLCRARQRQKQRWASGLEVTAHDPPNGSPGPRQIAESMEIGDRIAAAVAMLPDEQRAVFVLKVYEEMTFQSIAELLERPVGTVKSQMRLALGRLRGELRDLAEAYDVS